MSKKEEKSKDPIRDTIRKMNSNFLGDHRKRGRIDFGWLFGGVDDTNFVVDHRGVSVCAGQCPRDVYDEMSEIIASITCNQGPLIMPEVKVNNYGNCKLMQWQYMLYQGVIFFCFADHQNRALKWHWKAGLASRELWYLYCELSKTYKLSKW